MHCQGTENTVDTTLINMCVSFMYAPHASCHGMHKLSLFPTTMDVTLNMLLKRQLLELTEHGVHYL